MKFAYLRGCLSYLTHKPFDQKSLEGIRKERYRLALLGSLTNIFSTGISMLSLMVIVPITLPYLGEERFGIWMTVTSIASLLTFLDFGIGNGLINRVASANIDGDKKRLSFVITHGIVLLTIIAGVIALIILPLFNYFPWESLIKVKNIENKDEIRLLILAFVCIFAASVPLNSIHKIFQGMQLSWQANINKIVGSILSLIAVWLLAIQKANLPELLIATYGIQTTISLLLLVVLAKKNILKIAALNNPKLITESFILLRQGGLFFLLQIAGLIVWNIDTLVIASTLGAVNVTQFSLVQRLFQLVLLPLVVINSPLWSGYADAHARGDKIYIAKTLQKSIIGTIITAFCGVILIAAMSNLIFKFWIKDAVILQPILVWSYGGLIFFMAVGNSLAMFLNGVGEIRSQVITVGFFCILALPLKYLGIQLWGVPGLIFASIFSYVFAVLLPYLTIYKERMRSYFSN